MTDDLAAQVVTANHVLTNEGILDGFGHVSARPPGADWMYISSYGSAATVTADDIVRMDLEDGTLIDGEDVGVYSETAIHRAIYRARDDVNAVVHHHDPAIMPFTFTDVAIKPVFHLAAIFHEGVPVFDDNDPHKGKLIVGREESDRMAENLGDHRAQLLAGHGANVTGSTLKECAVACAYLSMNAKYQWQGELIGSPTYYTEPKEELESITQENILAERTVDRMWGFLLARL